MSQRQIVVTFGEIMMRLSPNGALKMVQAQSLDFFFGGTEMNVAASLSYFGLPVRHVSSISNDFTGDAAMAFMQSVGLDTRFINRTAYPLGLYFLEQGSSLRAGRIAYNRLNGAFANIKPEDLNWDDILQDAGWFHWTGITPAISENAYRALEQGLEVAFKKGIPVSADPTYRSNLWQYGVDPVEALNRLTSLSSLFIGGVEEINHLLGTSFTYTKDGFIMAVEALKANVPSVTKVYDKVRNGITASHQVISGRAYVNGTYFETEEIEVTAVTDRIGTGDAYAAGIIYGEMFGLSVLETLRFANAACAFKHTVLGDVNHATVNDILQVAQGSRGGRIKR